MFTNLNDDYVIQKAKLSNQKETQWTVEEE